MSYFLSICIPTWNRDDCLKETISSIIRQIEKFYLGNVEIIISDNASNDNTEHFCLNYAKEYRFVKYHRQSVNRGANANFQTVLSLATAKYCWLLGDDDLLVDDILPKVINDIMRYQPHLVIGPAVFDSTLKKATHLSVHEHKLVNRDYFVEENIIELAGKMSGLIFQRESLLPILCKAENLIKSTKTPWPHLVWIILLMSNANNKMLLLPYGTNQLVERHWHNLLFTGAKLIDIHFVKLQALVISMHPLIDNEFYNVIMSRSIYSREKILLKCVLYSTYLDEYWNILKYASRFFGDIRGFKNKISYLVCLLLPLILPIKVRRFALNLIGCGLRNAKLIKIIERLKISATLIKSNKKSLRAVYDPSQL